MHNDRGTGAREAENDATEDIKDAEADDTEGGGANNTRSPKEAEPPNR